MFFNRKNKQPVLAPEEVPTQAPDPIDQLESLLREVPQYEEGKPLDPRYFLASGLAIGLTTGFTRPHSDVDVVVTNAPNYEFDDRRIDRQSPYKSYGGLNLDPEFINATRVTAQTRPGHSESMPVDCLNPAIIMVQKLTDWCQNPPRPNDLADAAAPRDTLHTVAANNATGVPVDTIIRTALDAVPDYERQKTADRLETLLRG